MQATKAELRKNLRVKEKLPIIWQIQGQETRGQGMIKNISASGMMLEAKVNSPIPGDAVLAFEVPSQGPQAFIPALGRMVWSKQNGSNFSWGVEFVEPAQEIVAKLASEVQSKVRKIENAQKATNIVGGILFVAMLALIGYSLVQQFNNQKSIESANQILMASSNQQASLYTASLERYRQKEVELSAISQELNEAKALLAEAQQMLGGAPGDNIPLANRIKAMQNENVALMAQLNDAKEKIRLYSGEVANLEESKSAMQMIRNGLRLVKANLRTIKHKAHLAKIEAQRERDRIALELGNGGYLTKEGKLFVPAASGEKKIKINVDIVE